MKRLMLALFSSVLLSQVAKGNIEDFNCVDIYKQPAFQHPLLKHHKIQEKFSWNESFERENKYKTNDQICPKGTVPILRQKNGTESAHLNNTVEHLGQHFATMEIVHDLKIYRGVQADISIHNLTLKPDEYSKSNIWLENGPPNELNSIQVGWAVHPKLYGDSFTRLTIYWTADGYKTTGCYNTNCPGFVILSQNPWIGKIFTKTNVYGGESEFFLKPQIYQDGYTRNWIFKLSDSDEIIGYWPSELFPHLKQGAALLRFGGNTYRAPDGTSPPMGNGHFPSINLKEDSYIANFKVRDYYEFIEIEARKIKFYTDSFKCYRLLYEGKLAQSGVTFLFGGPGGNCGV